MPPRSRGIRDRKAELGESGEHTGLNGVHLPEARGARARHQPGSGGVSSGQPSNGNGAVLTHDPSRDNGAALAPHHLRVSIFGLGYVGTVSAACLARQGHHVIGLDSNPAKVEVLASGRSPVIEPGLAELIAAEVPRGRLAVSSDAVQAVRDTDISLYCVGTPGLENGSLDLDAVRAVCRSIGAALRHKSEFHVVVTRSTMLPGTTRGVVLPLLESASGKRAGVDFGVAVYPEFLREGTALGDFDHPPLVVMAATDERSQRLVAALCPGGPEQILHTSFEVAEMMKYVNNAWHGVKVAFANEIGTLCRAHGIDSHELMNIFVRDHVLNISAAYLRPGFAFGGSCIPKDLRALDYRARSLDLDTPLLSHVLPSNRAHIERALKLITAHGRCRVGMLGLSFKRDTDDTRESPMITLIETLLGRGYDVRVFDRNVQISGLVGANRDYMLNAIPHISRLMVSDLAAVIAHAETLVIGHADPAFDAALRTLGAGTRVVDLVRTRDRVPGSDRYTGICW
jgi:GDP-mannose 6-dehydrogenase